MVSSGMATAFQPAMKITGALFPGRAVVQPKSSFRNALHQMSIPVAGFIGLIGTISVIYAVYVQQRDLKCACVGGTSRVPLGFVSLSENIAMVAMAGWMFAHAM